MKVCRRRKEVIKRELYEATSPCRGWEKDFLENLERLTKMTLDLEGGDKEWNVFGEPPLPLTSTVLLQERIDNVCKEIRRLVRG